MYIISLTFGRTCTLEYIAHTSTNESCNFQIILTGIKRMRPYNVTIKVTVLYSRHRQNGNPQMESLVAVLVCGHQRLDPKDRHRLLDACARGPVVWS